jgi:hypothetical protein
MAKKRDQTGWGRALGRTLMTILLAVLAGGAAWVKLLRPSSPAPAPAQTCTPGDTQSCPGPCADNQTGSKICAPDGRSWRKCDCTGPVAAGQMAPEFSETSAADPASSDGRFCAIIASANPELLPPAVRDCFDTSASCRASFVDGRTYYPGTTCVAAPSALYCLDWGDDRTRKTTCYVSEADCTSAQEAIGQTLSVRSCQPFGVPSVGVQLLR